MRSTPNAVFQNSSEIEGYILIREKGYRSPVYSIVHIMSVTVIDEANMCGVDERGVRKMFSNKNFFASFDMALFCASAAIREEE